MRTRRTTRLCAPPSALLVAGLLAASALCCLAAGASDPDVPSSVVILTDKNFDELTATGAWMIEFYAPWCGHCKRLAPIWESAASRLAGKVNFAKIDGTVEKGVTARFNVRAYPTIKFIRDGDYEHAKNYKGGRTLERLEEYCAKMLGPATTHVSLETYEAARATAPVSFILLPQKPGSTAEDAFSHVARHWQDTHAFLISDAPELSRKLHAGPLPAVLLLRDAGGPEAFDGPLTKEALGQWVKENRFPVIAELDDYNWLELTTDLGRVTAVALVDPEKRDESARYLDELRSVALQRKGQFTFCSMNGQKWKDYVGTYGIAVEKGVLPQLLLLDMSRDKYIYRPDLKSAAEMDALLGEVAAGKASFARRPPQDFNTRLEYIGLDVKDFVLAWWIPLLILFVALNVLGVWYCCLSPPALEPSLADELVREMEALKKGAKAQ
eukprot:tig00020780_g13795.t1